MENQFLDDTLLTKIANTLRVLAIESVQKANSGHPGLPLGAADIVTVLWAKFLKHNPANPIWPDRDRFILSAGHGSALYYSLLHLWGYPFSIADLKAFRQWESRTPGHPEYEPQRGVEMTTGPLGQGFGTAVGIALAERWLAAYFNQPDLELVNHFTYVLASEGDLMEGISHEAASIAGHLKLGRLIVLYDDNRISIDGSTAMTYTDDVALRFEAYHWHVQKVDGHDKEAIASAITQAQSETTRPSIIICRTHIGYASPRQDSSKAHGEPLGESDLRQTKQNLGWPVDEEFFVPAEVLAWSRVEQQRCAERQVDWDVIQQKFREQFPALAQTWDQVINGNLPSDLESLLPKFSSADKPLATRAASGKVLDALSPHLPMLIGGSADLTPSNNTRPASGKDITAEDYSGNYIRFGVREHAMGTLMNGLALHGLRPYGGTFLVFSDYMRPAIRMAALMGLPVIYIFTHDSIGLGEDGPTHQPVEHLTALRAIPNLVVIRPADSNETRQAWLAALERRDGPTAMILTRQGLPLLAPENNDLDRGAYVITELPDGQAPSIALIASGSEVSLAVLAQQELAKKGIRAQVVSMPSWELFELQPENYKQQILPTGLPRVAIEAGRSLAWGKYLDGNGVAIGIDRFGASAPYQILYDKFGLSVSNIVDKVATLLDGG